MPVGLEVPEPAGPGQGVVSMLSQGSTSGRLTVLTGPQGGELPREQQKLLVCRAWKGEQPELYLFPGLALVCVSVACGEHGAGVDSFAPDVWRPC